MIPQLAQLGMQSFGQPLPELMPQGQPPGPQAGAQQSPQQWQQQPMQTSYFSGGAQPAGAGAASSGQSGGQIDWNAMNPFYKDPNAQPTSAIPSDADQLKALLGDALFNDTGKFRNTYMTDSEKWLRDALGRPEKRPTWVLGEGS